MSTRTVRSPAANRSTASVRRVTGSAIRHGFATFYWDAGAFPNHSCGLFDRKTGAHFRPTTLNAVITAN